MSQKEKSTKKSRTSKTSGGERSGGGKVFHQTYHTVTVPDKITGADKIVRVPGPMRRGLSDLNVVLFSRPGVKSRAMRRAGLAKVGGTKHELA